MTEKTTQETRYYYRDFDKPKKIHYTNAPFVGWTEPTGFLKVEYAQFLRRSDIIFVPRYLLTKETLETIKQEEEEKKKLVPNVPQNLSSDALGQEGHESAGPGEAW